MRLHLEIESLKKKPFRVTNPAFRGMGIVKACGFEKRSYFCIVKQIEIKTFKKNQHGKTGQKPQQRNQ